MEAKRVQRIRKIVRYYSELAGLTKADGKASPIIDLVSDLQHYCNDNGLDFAEILRIAANHFAVERSC